VRKIQAFILAAGYGERLRPITNLTPKPLLPILGKPIIEIVVEKIASLPVDTFGINMHHKSEMLIKWAESSRYANKIKIFHEKKILGTGGALKYAKAFLEKSTFIVHNSDIMSDIRLEKLTEEHLSSGNTVTLAVHNYEKFNNLWVDANGKLKNVKNAHDALPSGLCKIAFTGIAMYSPDFLEFLPAGNSSVVEAWLTALNEGRKIGTVDFSGSSWTDIGTPDAYASAVFEVLEKNGEKIYVHPSVDCSNTLIEGFAAFEKGCVTGSGTYLKNCVFLPAAQVPDGTFIEDAVVGPNYQDRKNEQHFSAPIPE
jgi:NDP-sugar pyrophosphorylase family protein